MLKIGCRRRIGKCLRDLTCCLISYTETSITYFVYARMPMQIQYRHRHISRSKVRVKAGTLIVPHPPFNTASRTLNHCPKRASASVKSSIGRLVGREGGHRSARGACASPAGSAAPHSNAGVQLAKSYQGSKQRLSKAYLCSRDCWTPLQIVNRGMGAFVLLVE